MAPEIVESDPAFDGLTTQQRAWVRHDSALWARAHEIAGRHPDLDVGDIHHALRALELAPSERLRRGLERVRVRPHKGLDSFDEEYARARECDIDGLKVRVLPLDRVIASKRAANRPKDAAQLPLLAAALAPRDG